VSEVASIGGFVKQYQVTVTPPAGATNLSIRRRRVAVRRATGNGRALPRDGGEGIHPARARLYPGIEDLKKVALGVGTGGVPILLGEIANVQLGPTCGAVSQSETLGETVGGIVVVRYGANARLVITTLAPPRPGDWRSPPDVKYSVGLRSARH